MSTILAIDAGPEKSAWCRIVDGAPESWGWEENDSLLERLRHNTFSAEAMVIEDVRARGGAPERQPVFDTVEMNGRFMEAFKGPCFKIGNSEHSGHICGDARANDSVRRRCLIERFGGERVVYGVKCGKCKQAGRVVSDVPCPEKCDNGFVAGKRAGTKKKCPRCGAKTTVRDYDICPTCKGSRWEVPPSALAGLSGPGTEHVFSAIAAGLTWIEKHKS